MTNKHLAWILLIAGLATHSLFFGHPNQTVFDEVHFGKFVSGYYTGEYYFDIHPPLGKLLIAGFGKLFDFRPEFSFANIGDEFPDSKYMALRFLPTLEWHTNTGQQLAYGKPTWALVGRRLSTNSDLR